MNNSSNQSQLRDERKRSLRTHALTGESYSQRGDTHKPSLFSQGSVKNSPEPTSDLESSKKMVAIKKSLFKRAAEDKAFKGVHVQLARKPLSIVQDSKEYTNSLESPTKPPSGWGFKREEYQQADSEAKKGLEDNEDVSPKKSILVQGHSQSKRTAKIKPYQSSLVVKVSKFKKKTDFSSEKSNQESSSSSLHEDVLNHDTPLMLFQENPRTLDIDKSQVDTKLDALANEVKEQKDNSVSL